MVRFTLFGIPVQIEPWFWLTTFLLGGGMGLLEGGANRSDLLWVLVWMIVACFSILVHEFGHALTARKLSPGRHWIRLWAMGGLAYHEGGQVTRRSRLWTIIMGPGAGFLLFFLTCASLAIAYGPEIGLGVVRVLIIGQRELPSPLYEIVVSPVGRICKSLIWINFWWSLVNLLPVFPLDGGQFFAEWTRKQKLAYQVGIVTGAMVAVAALLFLQSWYMALMFGFLAYNNFQQLSQLQK